MSAFASFFHPLRTTEYPKWHTELVNPNFAEFDEICGGVGIRVTRNEDLAGAFQQLADYDGPLFWKLLPIR